MNIAVLPDITRTISPDVAFFFDQGCTWERAHVLATFERAAEDILYATLQRESGPAAADGTSAYACQIRLSQNPDRVVARDVVRATTLRDASVRLALAKLYMRAHLTLLDEERAAVDRTVAIRIFVDTIEPFPSDDLRAALKTGVWYDRTALQPWQAEVIARALQWRATCGEREL